MGASDLANNAVNGATILNNSISGADVRNNSLSGADIRNNSLTGLDVRDGSIAFEDLAADAVFTQTIIVSPIGSDTDNCAVLYAAHDAITDAEQRNHYLVYIEPGIYDCRALGPLTMKEYVDISGAGRDATLIVGMGETTGTATIIAANHTSLRNLEVLNQTSGPVAARSTALLINTLNDFSVSNARLNAISANTCFTLVTAQTATFSMEHVQVRGGSGCALALGVDINVNNTVTMNDVESVVTGSTALSADGTVTARNSKFKANSSAVVTSVNSIARFASVQFDGAVTFNVSVGSIKCIGSYDGNFDPLDTTCH